MIAAIALVMAGVAWLILLVLLIPRRTGRRVLGLPAAHRYLHSHPEGAHLHDFAGTHSHPLTDCGHLGTDEGVSRHSVNGRTLCNVCAGAA